MAPHRSVRARQHRELHNVNRRRPSVLIHNSDCQGGIETAHHRDKRSRAVIAADIWLRPRLKQRRGRRLIAALMRADERRVWVSHITRAILTFWRFPEWRPDFRSFAPMENGLGDLTARWRTRRFATSVGGRHEIRDAKAVATAQLVGTNIAKENPSVESRPKGAAGLGMAHQSKKSCL